MLLCCFLGFALIIGSRDIAGHVEFVRTCPAAITSPLIGSRDIAGHVELVLPARVDPASCSPCVCARVCRLLSQGRLRHDVLASGHASLVGRDDLVDDALLSGVRAHHLACDDVLELEARLPGHLVGLVPGLPPLRVEALGLGPVPQLVVPAALHF